MKLSALLGFAAPLAAASLLRRTDRPRALYFLDNNPEGASIVALAIDLEDGTLGDPVRTPTGGVGLISENAMGPVDVDSIFSQDAVVVVGKRLFVVNPGSDTLSLFEISPDDPLRPTMVGEPVGTGGGEVPNTVAFSHRHHVACVATTGAVSGVMCYKVSNSGLSPLGDLMPLPVAQTTPPVGPPNTVSDMAFNPDQTALLVSIKGTGAGPGYVYAYAVADGVVCPDPVVSRPPELLINFSVDFVAEDRAVVTDPAYGASFVRVAPDLTVSVDAVVAVPGQGATCWSVYSDRFDSVYVLDGATPNVTTLDPASGDIKFEIVGPAEGAGSFDAVVDRSYLYVLQASPGVAVFSLKGSVGNAKVPSLVQYKDLSSLGSRQGWTGLAAYPSW